MKCRILPLVPLFLAFFLTPTQALAFSKCKTHLIPSKSLSADSFSTSFSSKLTSASPLSISLLTLSPENPKTGDDVALTFTASTNQVALSNLHAKLTILVLGIVVHEEKFDLCSELNNDQQQNLLSFDSGRKSMTCLIEPGRKFRATLRHKLAEQVPENVDITARIEFYEVNDDELGREVDVACIESDFSLTTKTGSEQGGEKAGLLKGKDVSKRFAFGADEVAFLMSKWLAQHEDSVYMPESNKVEGIVGVHGNINRQQIFRENLMKVATHNADESHGWKMGMNQFSHLTSEEFKQIYASGFVQTKRSKLSSSSQNDEQSKIATISLRQGNANGKAKVLGSNEGKFNAGMSLLNGMLGFTGLGQFSTSRSLGVAKSFPDEVNWVTAGAVTEVKNQGACGSCWSFATTGALEGAYFIKHHKLVSFSEQELVSCDHTDMGCNGGAMDSAYQWIEDNGGLCSEEAYPYDAGAGVRGFCNKDNCTPVKGSNPKSWIDVEHTEMSLEEAVAIGPVAVAIEADEASFQFYSSGVLTAPCSQNLDHGVLVVGYGVEEGTGDKYWLVKNSWGPMWGLQGYIKLVRGTEEELGGECGILLLPSYPQL